VRRRQEKVEPINEVVVTFKNCLQSCWGVVRYASGAVRLDSLSHDVNHDLVKAMEFLRLVMKPSF
jgi:hypothetical protein